MILLSERKTADRLGGNSRWREDLNMDSSAMQNGGQNSKAILWLSTISYIFWVVGVRLYYVDKALENSLMPSIIAVILFSALIVARNLQYKKYYHQAFAIKSRITECVFCLSTFLIPLVPLRNGVNFLLLDVVAITFIIYMRYVFFGVPLRKG